MVLANYSIASMGWEGGLETETKWKCVEASAWSLSCEGWFHRF